MPSRTEEKTAENRHEPTKGDVHADNGCLLIVDWMLLPLHCQESTSRHRLVWRDIILCNKDAIAYFGTEKAVGVAGVLQQGHVELDGNVEGRRDLRKPRG
jgi:hypothetical protein